MHIVDPHIRQVPMAEAAADGLPSSALGPKPDNSLLTFEFQVIEHTSRSCHLLSSSVS